MQTNNCSCLEEVIRKEAANIKPQLAALQCINAELLLKPARCTWLPALIDNCLVAKLWEVCVCVNECVCVCVRNTFVRYMCVLRCI